MKKTITSVLLAAAMMAAPLSAAPLNGGGVERLIYSWHLKGALRWIARIAFPSSGRGILETHDEGTVSSRLVINASDEKGYYLYESQMTPEGAKTLVSRSAYSYGDNTRDERVSFDPARGVAHVQKTMNNKTETKTKNLESAVPQDVLTTIYYIRQHVDELTMPRHAKFFSGAKGYDVIIRPLPATTAHVGKNEVRVLPFAITAVNDHARFGGEVRVALSDDERHVPVTIDIQEKYARIKLDLQP